MKQGLFQTARLQQSLMLTPQLQQAIKLLTMSAQELVDEVQRVVDDNVCLEIEEPGYDGEPGAAADIRESPDVEQSAEPAGEDFSYENGASSDFGGDDGDFGASDFSPADDIDHQVEDSARFDEDEPRAEDDWQSEIPDQLPVDSSWDDVYAPSTGLAAGEEGDDRDFESRTAIEEDLQDHLLWQLNLSRLSDRDRLIGQAIIEAVNEDGFLTVPIEDVHAGLDAALEIEHDEIEVVLHLIQQFDPLGVAARDLRECLLVQLAQLPSDTPYLQEAIAIVSRHLDLLAGQQTLLCRRLHIDEATLGHAVRLIRGLDPKPGSRFASRKIEYIVPEVIVSKERGRWLVEINPDIAPKLRINQGYAAMIPRGGRATADASAGRYLKEKMQEAKWFINGLKHRSETLLRVATKIVELQIGFFEHGTEHLRPLVLKDIAEAIGVHESTISRVTTRKYMHTPRGVFELKYFFSAQVSTTNGESVANKVIQEKIRKLCEAEDKRKPLSDAQIVALLEKSNYQVARRTVAKYRDALGIPSSNERRRLI
jgi:RNA polymerase sigma-54 factor